MQADATIGALDLDAPGEVAWWSKGDVTLHQMLVHVLADSNRHAGHADILRAGLDGAAGLNADNPNLPDHDATWWENYRARIERAAKAAASNSDHKAGDQPTASYPLGRGVPGS